MKHMALLKNSQESVISVDIECFKEAPFQSRNYIRKKVVLRYRMMEEDHDGRGSSEEDNIS